MFNDTATFGNYISLLEEACSFLRFPTAWLTPVVRHGARGLKKCQDRSFRFPNFIRSQLIAEIIARETPASEFAQACFFSFLFSIRVLSETLHLRRAYSADRLTEFTPQVEKALIGVVEADVHLFLVAKLTRRKNLASGCILRMPSFCGLVSSKSKAMCLAHTFWPDVRRRVSSGQPGPRRLPGATLTA